MNTPTTRLVITDIDIPFWSAVGIILKWSLAAIPAALILWILGVLTMVLFSALGFGFYGLTHPHP